MMAETKKKRKDLSLKEKQEILQRYDKLPTMSQRKAAAQLKISQPLLCKILKNRTNIELSAVRNENVIRKRNRTSKYSQVELALKLWFHDVCKKNAPINGLILRQKAEELAKEMGREDFIATGGWLSRWKKRENIACRNEKATQLWIKTEWPKITAEYSPENVYNASEMILYFRAMPNSNFMFKHGAKGFNSFKERVTVLCCANMSGEKERLLVIGKTKNPRCFKGVKHLPVDYCWSVDAWMTTTIFNNWLVKWDRELKRKIVLLVDNCPAYMSVNDAPLRNIKVILFPENTSLIQPCDQGIIHSLKAYYRRIIYTRILGELEDTRRQTDANDIAKRISLLDALHLLTMCWKQVSKRTVENCFKKAGFIKTEVKTSANETESIRDEIMDNPPEGMSKKEFKNWLAIDDEIHVSTTISSEVIQTFTSGPGRLADENEAIQQEDSSEDPPTNAQMEEALQILRRGVQHRSNEFQKHYEYELFINELLEKTTGKQ
ncbi:tigger transposable element-derived protein 4-like [Centruroides sculpturatus]|uniref:tigger transposable element-derived protein 4-like n=1 Tax=Centruroides sculpturatus TaxID=218467 RepID=UPI000C6DF921|nr:tigger transposable element-derived protein 4-like [Centruroides sculpturatus]